MTKSTEDEFFATQDAEKIRLLREKLDGTRAEQCRQHEKETHWMRCPKCGATLQEIAFKGVMVDRCVECQGVWLDPGELEILAGHEPNLLKNMAEFFHVHRES